MKKKKIIIYSIIVVALIFFTICFVIFNNYRNEKNNSLINESKKEYYDKMYKRMYAYYKIVYKNMNYSEEMKDSIIRINLGTLKTEGFPMEDFVSYDGNDECDIALSYAVRKVVNNKYQIEVFYKCGNDANYDYVKFGTKIEK